MLLFANSIACQSIISNIGCEHCGDIHLLTFVGKTEAKLMLVQFPRTKVFKFSTAFPPV